LGAIRSIPVGIGRSGRYLQAIVQKKFRIVNDTFRHRFKVSTRAPNVRTTRAPRARDAKSGRKEILIPSALSRIAKKSRV